MKGDRSWRLSEYGMLLVLAGYFLVIGAFFYLLYLGIRTVFHMDEWFIEPYIGIPLFAFLLSLVMVFEEDKANGS